MFSGWTSLVLHELFLLSIIRRFTYPSTKLTTVTTVSAQIKLQLLFLLEYCNEFHFFQNPSFEVYDSELQ